MASPSVAAAAVANLSDYKFFIPPLPVSASSIKTAYLHCDVDGRPYDMHDFVEEFKRLSILGSLRGCGVMQRNHLWNVWFRNAESLDRLLEAKELTVKGRRCLVIDVRSREVQLKLHWVPSDVADRAVKKALRHFCSVQQFERRALLLPAGVEKWATVSARVTLKEGLTVEDVPHRLKLKPASSSLVTILGRLPLCLRCKEKGHLRRECTAPRCALCARVGHADSSCPRKPACNKGSSAAGGHDAGADDKLAKAKSASRKSKKSKKKKKKSKKK